MCSKKRSGYKVLLSSVYDHRYLSPVFSFSVDYRNIFKVEFRKIYTYMGKHLSTLETNSKSLHLS